MNLLPFIRKHIVYSTLLGIYEIYSGIRRIVTLGFSNASITEFEFKLRVMWISALYTKKEKECSFEKWRKRILKTL